MSTENQLDIFRDAEQRRDIGIARVEAGQENDSPGWGDRACTLLTEFICFRRSTPFLTEDFVRWADGRIEPPQDGRAWGPVIQKAARRKLVRMVGYAPASSSNLSPKSRWQAA